jgi:nicotinamidase-related amidase
MITALDKTTALVLIDLQNSIVSVQTKPHSVEDVLKNVNELIAAFRKKKLPIVLVNVKPSGTWLQSRKETKMPPFPDDETAYKISNKINSDKNDICITKHTWSAFFETELNNELKKKLITNIVLGGISTSAGVEGTARAASELGYNITLATDAMTDRNESAHYNSIQNIFPRLGETGTTKEIIEMLNKTV